MESLHNDLDLFIFALGAAKVQALTQDSGFVGNNGHFLFFKIQIFQLNRELNADHAVVPTIFAATKESAPLTMQILLEFSGTCICFQFSAHRKIVELECLKLLTNNGEQNGTYLAFKSLCSATSAAVAAPDMTSKEKETLL